MQLERGLTMNEETTTELSYCVKRSGHRPPWRGPLVWDKADPNTGDVIEIEGERYRVLDAAVSEPGYGWANRHISAYVERETTR